MRTREQAQNNALSGEAESQDTQEVMGQYHQQFGVGFTSSSPPQPIPADEVRAEMQRCPRPPKVHQKWIGANISVQHPTSSAKQNADASKTRANADGKVTVDAKSRSQSAKEDPATAGSCKGAKGRGPGADGSSASKRPGGVGTKSNASNSRASSPSHHTKPAHSPKQVTHSEASGIFEPAAGSQSGGEHAQQRHEDTVIPLTSQTGSPTGTVNPAQSTVLNDDADGVAPYSAKQRKPRRRKMDPSQSPTQSNDGRSYDQYISRGDDLIPTDPVEKPELASQQTSHSGDGDRTLQEDDTGAVNFRNIDDYNDNFSAPDSLGTGRPSHGSPDHFAPNPETPAPHKNPFAGSKAHLLPASQMFGQTQVSSAYKLASPTSSRPSPDNFQPQNSISPNLFISSPLKNLGTGLRPTHAAVSSPQIPYDTSPRDQSDEPVEAAAAALGSTPVHPARTFPRGRAEEYEPLYTYQQAYESSSQHALENESDGNASDDDAMRRHYKALFKKAKVEEKLASIKYERKSPLDDAVVPSTNTRQGENQKTDSQEYRDQCEGRADNYSQNTVEDSQDRVAVPSGGGSDSQNAVIDDSQEVVITRSAESAAQGSSNDVVVMATLPNTARSAPGSPVINTDNSPKSPPKSPPRGKGTGDGVADPVLETSPVLPQPRPFHEMQPLSSGSTSKQESFTTLLRSSLREHSSSESYQPLDSMRAGGRTRSSSQAWQPATHRDGADPDAPHATSQAAVRNTAPRGSVDRGLVEIAETSPVVESHPRAPALSTRSRRRASRNQSNNTSPPVSGSSGSSLSALTTTPNVSSKTTPLTEDSPDVAGDATLLLNAEPHTSPSAAKAGRSKGKGVATKPKPAAAVTRNLRTSTRQSTTSFGRAASVSTDELARSPPSSAPTAFEQSAMLSRLGRSSLRESPASRASSRGGGPNLFAGMIFAVSFQAKHSGEKDSTYNSRMGLSTKVGEQIRQGGGKILPNGFEELFEFGAIKNAEVATSTPSPDEEIKLTASARAAGFTALIADGHSRKVKYMQALALGLPCIHPRWITTCTEKQRLVSWSDYLLCAGNSSFLGDAIRSRKLPIYDAASAKLNEVINTRPRFLRGSRILLVLRKQDEGKKMAYVFLARVLGASLSRVYTVDEARRQLKASEDAGHPYDWVDVEEKVAGKAVLFADDISSKSTAPAASKKRKRKSAAEAANPAPKKIRTLSNELVIQSLILGRLIEEDEGVL